MVVPKPVFNKGWERIVCVASGPSLTAEQGFLISTASDWKVIAINTTWQRVPMADVIYACDQNWWKRYHMDVAAKARGECWTQDRWAAHKYGLHHVQAYDRPGLSREVGVIHSGGNSGYQALNLAYLFGAREIILVGYDFQRTYGMSHWHGDHPLGMGPVPDGNGQYIVSGSMDSIGDWVDRMQQMAADLEVADVRVSNASIETALPWFERVDLRSALWR